MTGAGSFGDLLRCYRLAAGLTQEELAERAGVSPRAISDLERGQRSHPWRDTVQLLAAALDLAPADRTRLEHTARRPLPAAAEPADRASLPAQLTSFIGRERELDEVRRLLATTRLLTLTGIGGSGKTRLALQVAATLPEPLAGDIAFVPLATVTTPDLAAAAVLQALGLPDISNASSPWSRLARILKDRRTLLVLDNLEQVASIGPEVARLLEHCPGLTILATSRAALRVSGEHEYVVPPFDPPGPDDLTSPDRLRRNDAVCLFVERSRAVRPDFALGDDNAAAVAGICRRLDGLPLAIELAAVRARVFSPGDLLRRLDRRLALLTGGGRDRPTRQQTLRATLDWSYDLLTPAEQALFRRLAVFVGGFALGSAEWVCRPSGDRYHAPGTGQSRPPPGRDARLRVPSEDGLGVLDGIDSLVGWNLLQVIERPRQTRFAMLETTREYALERLAESGDEAGTRARHAAHYLALASASAAMDKIPEGERDNLLAALRWFEERSDVAGGVRLLDAMNLLWTVTGPLAEGMEWLARFQRLPAFATAPGEVRACALAVAAGQELRRDALAMRRRGEELLALSRAAPNPAWLERALLTLAWSSLELGDLSRADGELAEALALGRKTGSASLIAWALNLSGDAARLGGRDDLARTRYEESLAWPAFVFMPWRFRSLGFLSVHRGDLEAAESHFRASLAGYVNEANTLGKVECLVGFASLAAARGDARRAACLLGAVESALPTIGVKLYFGDRFERERALQALRTAMSDRAFAAAWAEGQAMAVDQAVAYALGAED